MINKFFRAEKISISSHVSKILIISYLSKVIAGSVLFQKGIFFIETMKHF